MPSAKGLVVRILYTSIQYLSRSRKAQRGTVRVACFLRAVGGMKRSMTAVRYQTAAIPRAGIVLLLVLLAHLIVMATPFQLVMIDGDRADQEVMAVEGDDGQLDQISLIDHP